MPSTIQPEAAVNDMTEAKKRYILSNDAAEIERMTHQHEWIKASAGGLIKAPIDLNQENLRVLDSATADGIWITDIAAVVPKSASLVGFDIAPELFPPQVVLPASVQLTTHDLLAPLPDAWTSSFDLVHQRFILPSFPPQRLAEALHGLTQCVKPGGWIQLVEPDAIAPVSDPRAEAFATMQKISGHIMPNPNPGPLAYEHLKNDLGWADVRMETVDVVIGDYAENREAGIRGRKSFSAVLGKYMQACSPETFGMTAEQWEGLPVEFERDTRLYKVAIRQNFVVARKPM